jgi:hypothetical protein
MQEKLNENYVKRIDGRLENYTEFYRCAVRTQDPSGDFEISYSFVSHVG